MRQTRRSLVVTDVRRRESSVQSSFLDTAHIALRARIEIRGSRSGVLCFPPVVILGWPTGTTSYASRPSRGWPARSAAWLAIVFPSDQVPMPGSKVSQLTIAPTLGAPVDAGFLGPRDDSDQADRVTAG